jgi:heavy metal sensor kinase
VIRSIRFSLVVYFLLLLTLALGAAFGLVYSLARQTVTDKLDNERKRIDAQFTEKAHEEERRLDEKLLVQAQALAGLVQVQTDWPRLTGLRLQALGVLSVGATPQAPLLMPLWLAESVRGRTSWELSRSVLAELRFNETEVLPRLSPGLSADSFFFQIDSDWGSSYRSESLVTSSFPGNPRSFAPTAAIAHRFSTVELEPNLEVRSVQLKVPATRMLPFGLGWGRSHRGNDGRAPGTDSPRSPGSRRPEPGAPSDEPTPPAGSRPTEPGADVRGPDGSRAGRPEGPRFPAPRSPGEFELPMRPSLYIQCAVGLDEYRNTLAKYREARDKESHDLEARTAAGLANLRNRLLLTSTLTFAAAVLGTLLLVRRGLAPLASLGHAVSKVSPRDFRLPLGDSPMPRELGPIVARLNGTLGLLKRAFEREKQATADISHELRTPLAAMLTTLEIALRKPRRPEEYRELLEDCRLSAQQMNQIVERLLTLARLDAGVDLLRAQTVDLAELADQCAAVVRPLAEARGLRLRVQRNGALPVATDPDKMREVLMNLLHNAIQYNRPEGSIEVQVGRQDGQVEVAVRDTGIGMPAEVRGRIFERFYRADQARNEDGMHAGLGLAIVKEYVDLMGGRIVVDSAEGQGSTFRVSLPDPGKA